MVDKKQAYRDACELVSKVTGKPADHPHVKAAAGVVSKDAFEGMCEERLIDMVEMEKFALPINPGVTMLRMSELARSKEAKQIIKVTPVSGKKNEQ